MPSCSIFEKMNSSMKLRTAIGWVFGCVVLGAISAVSLFSRSIERAGTSGCFGGVSATRRATSPQLTAIAKRTLFHIQTQASTKVSPFWRIEAEAPGPGGGGVCANSGTMELIIIGGP